MTSENFDHKAHRWQPASCCNAIDLSKSDLVASKTSIQVQQRQLMSSELDEEQSPMRSTQILGEPRQHSVVPYASPVNRLVAQSKPDQPKGNRRLRQVAVPAISPKIRTARSGQIARGIADREPAIQSVNDQPRLAARSLPLQAQQPATASSAGAKCALILQRTYVRKATNERASGEQTNGNDLSNDKLLATGKRERICITYKDVNKAIALAKQRRKFSQVPDDEINSIEPSVPVIAKLGELNQEVTKILQQTFDLSSDEILNGLTLIDMSRTDFWPLCPLMVRPIRCDPAGRFRSFTGHCNNLQHPAWGAAQTPFVRYLAPKHPDGIQQERVSVVDGSPLPSPRLITSLVHRDHDQPSSDLSLLIMVWGQVIDHDVALAAPPRGK